MNQPTATLVDRSTDKGAELRRQVAQTTDDPEEDLHDEDTDSPPLTVHDQTEHQVAPHDKGGRLPHTWTGWSDPR